MHIYVYKWIHVRFGQNKRINHCVIIVSVLYILTMQNSTKNNRKSK